MRGEGVQRDLEIGLKWLDFAASRGHPVAQNRLARIYASGVGVKTDVVEAAKWNILATAGGRPDPTLDDMMTKLTPDERKEAEARAKNFKLEETSPD
jgi:TPR repeat protein